MKYKLNSYITPKELGELIELGDSTVRTILQSSCSIEMTRINKGYQCKITRNNFIKIGQLVKLKMVTARSSKNFIKFEKSLNIIKNKIKELDHEQNMENISRRQ